MKMQVIAEQCTGCGACVETCPSGAIFLSDGLAILDQAICTQCQACVDTCPAGAITAIELPEVVTQPAAIQPVREAEIVAAEPIPSSPKQWLSTALAFAGREILPRMADALIAALDRRLALAQSAKPQVYVPSPNAKIAPMQNRGRGYRRRSRSGQVRHRGRGQGRGAGKENWR
jgi:NAD-dependent dihydropyrimidine dehydrogenase PreA subunit